MSEHQLTTNLHFKFISILVREVYLVIPSNSVCLFQVPLYASSPQANRTAPI